MPVVASLTSFLFHICCISFCLCMLKKSSANTGFEQQRFIYKKEQCCNKHPGCASDESPLLIYRKYPLMYCTIGFYPQHLLLYFTFLDKLKQLTEECEINFVHLFLLNSKTDIFGQAQLHFPLKRPLNIHFLRF